MQKIVIDTNVILSSLIGNSFPKEIIFDFVLNKKISLCLSEMVFGEYAEVLHREKFKKYPDFVKNAEILLHKLNDISIYYFPTEKINIVKDEFDNRFLELGIEAQADYLITGNTNHFNFKFYKNLQIVTPQEFVNVYFSI